MIKSLWFLIKITLLVVGAVWVVRIPGTVDLAWANYTVTMKIGFFLLLLAVVIMMAIFLYNIITTFAKLPASYARYREIRHREKGYRALTLGLTAVAAGDAKVAKRETARTLKYMSNDNGLPMLLKAQTARLIGDEKEALASYAALIENKDAAFFGVRGLLQAAIDHKRHDKALALARQALGIHPKQPWILKLVYDLELKEQHWDDALKTLDKIQWHGVFEKDDVKSDRVAILLAKAEQYQTQDLEKLTRSALEDAFRYDPAFSPATCRLARFYIDHDARSRALTTLKKGWKAEPHADIAALWSSLVPHKKAGDSIARMKWFEKLYKLNKSSARAHIEAAHAAMKEGLWGPARTYLNKAEQNVPTQEVYTMLADLERISGEGEESAKIWLAKKEQATPEPRWICSETGRTYTHWAPIALPHGSFNTIEWSVPDTTVQRTSSEFSDYIEATVLEAPR